MQDAAAAYARRHADRFVAELADLVRIPSVSGDARRAPDLARCARRFASALATAGLEHACARPLPGGAPPVVTADWLHAPPGAPTVLVYGHYDVQPADERWDNPPFEPVVRGGVLYGRGASDDKGQVFAHVKAIECLLATRRALPVNLRVVIEGEEEIGSAGLGALIEREPGLFAADVAVISDMPIISPDQPAITTAMRGTVSATLTVQRRGTEVHSGLYGGAVADPLLALCRLGASLRGPDGRIALPGFYDRVRPLAAGERAELARTAALERKPSATAGDAPEDPEGEPGYTATERATIRPSLTITGITGGYQGEGQKAVLAARASMKVNVRLVPDQDPAEVMAALRRHARAHVHPAFEVRVVPAAGAPPVVVDRAHPAVGAAARAYQRGFGRPPLYRRSGGSLPPAGLLQRRLGMEPLLLGFALPDDRMHGPNEKFHLPTFFRGIATSIALLEELAAACASSILLGRVRHDHRLPLPRR